MIRIRGLTLGLLAGACATARPTPTLPAPEPYDPATASLELHAHLFMKEGLDGAFNGEFFGPLAAKDWRALFDSQANPETLEGSGIGLLVVALYAHPFLEPDRRQAVRDQIDLVDRFVAEHPNWIVAQNPAQAHQALARGQRVIVLSLEHAYGVLETDADLDEFVGHRRVRIVTFQHLIDDVYGGGALLPGIHALINPWRVVISELECAHEDGILVNHRGLSRRGHEMAQKLLRRGVWLDLTHASDTSARDLIALDEAAGAPVLYTHAPLRKYLKAERGLADWELAAIARTRGVLGLMPSDEMLAGTEASDPTCVGTGGVRALARQWTEAAAVLPPESIALGSDYNGGVTHLPPTCPPLGTGLDAAGLWNIGQAGEVWRSLEKLGAPVARPLPRTIDHFLEAWDRAISAGNRLEAASPLEP